MTLSDSQSQAHDGRQSFGLVVTLATPAYTVSKQGNWRGPVRATRPVSTFSLQPLWCFNI